MKDTMDTNNKRMNDHIIGTSYALAAFIAWGLLPAYWKLLQQIPLGEILAHRVFWSFVFVSGVLLLKGQWSALKHTISVRENRLPILLSAILISLNWSIYIWAVNSNQIVEASMGYYITPLFSVFLGLIVLHERLNFWQWIALIFALTGVLFLTVKYGRIPWIAVALTLTFGLYGLSKKLVPVDSLIALGLETLLISPLCLAYIAFKQHQGEGAFGRISLTITILLIFSGVVTAFPLLWFARAAKKIPLSKVGFIQYLAPTLALLLGVIIYKEPFTTSHLISFGCIWCALVLYSCSHTSFLKNLQPNKFR
jgi:chloramphenicol-sensitive protein RarD